MTKQSSLQNQIQFYRLLTVFLIGIVLAISYNRHTIIAPHTDKLVPEDWQMRKVEERIQQNIMKQFQNLPSFLPTAASDFPADEFHIGSEMSKQGYNLTHPVVLIPGIVSTALEAWSTNDSTCGKKYFRKRMWGTFNHLQTLFLDKECWLKYMTLDPETGLDFDHFRLRASAGLEASDYLFPGYWLLAKLISNIAAIGGDINTIQIAPYDWRLGFTNLEKRDLFFSKLQTTIELSYKLKKEKVVIIGHSMGNLIFFYFLNWIQSPLGGNQGTDWADKHIKSWINLAGPLLGVPKVLAPMLSGETRDSAELNQYASEILQKFMPKSETLQMFQSFDGAVSLFPKGGEILWKGTGDHIPDAPTKFSGEDYKTSSAISFKNGKVFESATIEQVIEKIMGLVGESRSKRWREMYDFGMTNKVDKDYLMKPKTWANPLLAPLPKFKSKDFKIYCFYGVGVDTERSYYYNETQIDTSYFDKKSHIAYGIQVSDGDGTVPLLSSGYMCNRGWQSKLRNPSMVKVTTHELDNPKAQSFAFRSPSSVEHTDILGNSKLLRMILSIVSGKDEVESRKISDIDGISDRVDHNTRNV